MTEGRNLHHERLIRLADKLEGKGPYEEIGPIPKKKFNLLGWFKRVGLSNDPKNSAKECGFVACACGWAATDPWFRRRRFTVPSWGSVEEFFFSTEDREKGRAFNLEGPAHNLFSHHAYKHPPTPKQVAQCIREFVKDGEKKNG